MKLLRLLLAAAVLAYAGWLAWPMLSPWFEGAAPGEAAARSGAEAALAAAGNTPRLIVWGAAILLYVLSALLLGAGNPRAVVAYLMAFAADAFLRIAMADGGGLTDASARTLDVAPAGIDPQWVILGLLLLGAALVMLASRRRRRQRTVLNLSEA